jgi:hypothetical protein
MLWLTLWFMVILKIPILYLAYVLWWAVKDPPKAYAGPAAGEVGDGGGPGWRPSRSHGRFRQPRGRPHGSPDRRPVRARAFRARGAPARSRA